MKVTYNWLKDFVEIKIPAKALAGKLTMSGLEVTSLEEKERDFIFEIEVTSNRPDWLSVIGIAREVAAITNTKLRAYSVERIAYSKKLSAKRYPLNAKTLKIEIENRKDCPLYTAKIIRNVKVGPSPDWLKNRLELIGCRSVNNVVDITNYVLFALGEPLHAFDLDKLVSPLASYPVSPLQIIIRRAKKGEEIITIDGIKRILNEEILIIASGTNRQTGKPIAIAGVMGSKDTEVTQTTKNILLEAAAFNPIIVCHGRRALEIQSESSYRFERGINLEMVDNASWQAAELIKKFAGGNCVTAKNSGLAKTKRKSIILESSAVNRILGTNIPAAKMQKILNSLEFKTKTKPKNRFLVGIPNHRLDATEEVDLIEEIARIYGYENVRQTLPAVKPQASVGETRDLVSLIKNILAGLGLNEVITYSLMDKDLLRSFQMYEGHEVIEILNPLSKEQEILRPRLIPGLAACVAYNLNQKQEYINIFEVAGVFSQSKSSPQEELRLGIALCGIKSLLLKQGLIKDAVGLLYLKGILEVLFERLGVRDYHFSSKDNAYAVYVGTEEIGLMAKLEKPALDELGIKNKDVFVLELSLDRLLFFANLNKKFLRLPVYPGILRDISIILKNEIPAGDILDAIRKQGEPLLKEARVSDYYKGKQIPAGFKGLTITCFYCSDERTLTELEINPVHSLVCKLLSDRFGCQIR